MSNLALSVIVPVYNAGKYLPVCLDSLTNQTLQNIEIILVDDGSTDDSGAICDRYANMDSRFRVIHQANCGVSAARNAGLEAASGAWIGWVDSDDWIEPDQFSFLLTLAEEHQAQISVCGRFEECWKHRGRFGCETSMVLEREAALLALLQENGVDNALYDKLCKRELYHGIQFPVGQTFEDLAVVWQLFAKADRVAFSPEQKYHYRHHGGGIMGNTALSNRMHHYHAARQRCAAMGSLWPQFLPELEERSVTSAIGIWSAWYHNPRHIRKAYWEELEEIAQYVKPRISAVLQRTGYGFAGRMVVRLLPYPRRWAFALAGVIGWLYQIKHGRTL